MNGGQVILADEPTGALDSHSGEEVMAILHQLRDQGHTVIIVTHDPQVAAQAERIIEIHDGELVSNPPPRESRLRRRKKFAGINRLGAIFQRLSRSADHGLAGDGGQ
jgi:macrolide transport system ATP-binding/permease protein